MSFSKFGFVSTAVVSVALVFASFAEDDLDELLQGVEGGEVAAPVEKKAEAVKAEAPVEKPAEEVAPAAEEAKAEEVKAAAPAEKAEEPAAEAVAEKSAEAPAPTAEAVDAELLANIRATEILRRRSLDAQAKREIAAARQAMKADEYVEAATHYNNAFGLLNDGEMSKKFKRECEQGIAEGYYRAALQEDHIGRRDRAMKLIDKAIEWHHPKALRQREAWVRKPPEEPMTDVSEIVHRRQEDDYKAQRIETQKHLKRARQYLAVRDLDKALDEVELVLVSTPHNQEAIRLRGAIQRKRRVVLGQEFEVTREGMIADVTKAWRPVYAPNVRKLKETASATVKTALGDDPERALEQTIIKRMKDMRLPSIAFKPPATIIDAVEFFRGASKDYDRPEIPIEQRGFNFVLKTPEVLKSQAAAEEEGGDENNFGESEEDAAPKAQAGVPQIPMITASNISFYDALKLVCESVDYKFKVQGPIVVVMHKNMSTEEMLTRSYPVLAQFLERIGSAASEIRTMKGPTGFGDTSNEKAEEASSQEKDWKQFFQLMGVQWPEGSSILYIKTIGKLRVKNTADNLAELEKALTELNVDQKLIEIEARFVEVKQDDLNSLGFEWILNSDYSPNLGRFGKFLGIENGHFGSGTSSTTTTISATDISGSTNYKELTSVTTVNSTDVDYNGTSNGARWTRGNDTNVRNIGINAFGGTSNYGNGNRYLSTEGNHISGEGKSTNDQFMRFNAFLGSADLSMILHMISQRSDTDLLNAPKVLTRPGEQAVIKVVTEYIYPTDYDVQLQSSSSSSGSSSGSSQSAILAIVEPQSFTMREVGVILDVTPTLTDDGNLIDLKLNTQVVDEPTWYDYGMDIPFSGNSSMTSFTGIGEIYNSLAILLEALGLQLTSDQKNEIAASAVQSANTAMNNLTSAKNTEKYHAPMKMPWFHVRSIDSSISIQPGATIVMGGLIREERKAMDDKVPFLGDLPFVGRFFRSHAESTAKRNLLIFVTTRLVDVRGREVTLGGTDVADTEVKAAPVEAKD